MLCTLIGAIILSINIQVGLNMHLYDDIGDASSSLWGSTSSLSTVQKQIMDDDGDLSSVAYNAIRFQQNGTYKLNFLRVPNP